MIAINESILTPTGPRLLATLQPGDSVLLHDGLPATIEDLEVHPELQRAWAFSSLSGSTTFVSEDHCITGCLSMTTGFSYTTTVADYFYEMENIKYGKTDVRPTCAPYQPPLYSDLEHFLVSWNAYTRYVFRPFDKGVDNFTLQSFVASLLAFARWDPTLTRATFIISNCSLPEAMNIVDCGRACGLNVGLNLEYANYIFSFSGGTLPHFSRFAVDYFEKTVTGAAKNNESFIKNKRYTTAPTPVPVRTVQPTPYYSKMAVLTTDRPGGLVNKDYLVITPAEWVDRPVTVVTRDTDTSLLLYRNKEQDG